MPNTRLNSGKTGVSKLNKIVVNFRKSDKNIHTGPFYEHKHFIRFWPYHHSIKVYANHKMQTMPLM